MDSRRRFIGKMASGLAGTIAVPGAVLGSNERIRIGIIGLGERGMQLGREAAACENVEVVAFADVYSQHLEMGKQLAPGAKGYSDYRHLLEDKNVDAVLIATPHHLHCQHFVASLEAGKHVYQEKTMAFTLDHAKRMRAAVQKAGKRTVQIGHQFCTSGVMKDAQGFVDAGWLGKITAIHAHMYRNTPHGKPQWQRPVHGDITPENVDWSAFLGEAPEREFDADRYLNWRFFWDYSGGNVHESMCQQLAFWYKVLALRIPAAVTMVGGVYLWKDGREVPDTMSVSMEHSEEVLFTWNSGFGNNHLGSREEVLGTDGTIAKGQQIRYLPQKVNRPEGREELGRTKSEPRGHVHNFLDCIRSGRETNCPFELGFRVSVACNMAAESYRLGRTTFWDPNEEQIL